MAELPSRCILDTDPLDLSTLLAAGEAIYGRSVNPQITLKALSYFGDGDLPKLPDAVKNRLLADVQAVNLDRLPNIGVR
jgi:hypothetical protein